jgi:phytoene dehydrogenase-like protein
VIVIGAGHNGLTCAAALARAGRAVTVIEARERIGGLAGVFEFHPGYRGAGVLHDTSRVRPGIVDSLSLEHHDLRLRPTRPDLLALGEGGGAPALLVTGDPIRAATELTRRGDTHPDDRPEEPRARRPQRDLSAHSPRALRARGGWSDEAAALLAERAIDELATHIVDLRESCARVQPVPYADPWARALRRRQPPRRRPDLRARLSRGPRDPARPLSDASTNNPLHGAHSTRRR